MPQIQYVKGQYLLDGRPLKNMDAVEILTSAAPAPVQHGPGNPVPTGPNAMAVAGGGGGGGAPADGVHPSQIAVPAGGIRIPGLAALYADEGEEEAPMGFNVAGGAPAPAPAPAAVTPAPVAAPTAAPAAASPGGMEAIPAHIQKQLQADLQKAMAAAGATPSAMPPARVPASSIPGSPALPPGAPVPAGRPIPGQSTWVAGYISIAEPDQPQPWPAPSFLGVGTSMRVPLRSGIEARLLDPTPENRRIKPYSALIRDTLVPRGSAARGFGPVEVLDFKQPAGWRKGYIRWRNQEQLLFCETVVDAALEGSWAEEIIGSNWRIDCAVAGPVDLPPILEREIEIIRLAIEAQKAIEASRQAAAIEAATPKPPPPPEPTPEEILIQSVQHTVTEIEASKTLGAHVVGAANEAISAIRRWALAVSTPADATPPDPTPEAAAPLADAAAVVMADEAARQATEAPTEPAENGAVLDNGAVSTGAASNKRGRRSQPEA